jgi:hypothetical protein
MASASEARARRVATGWNQRFSSALPDESAYQPRAALAATDARTLARELLGMSSEECSRAFRRSPTARTHPTV